MKKEALVAYDYIAMKHQAIGEAKGKLEGKLEGKLLTSIKTILRGLKEYPSMKAADWVALTLLKEESVKLLMLEVYQQDRQRATQAIKAIYAELGGEPDLETVREILELAMVQ